MPFRSKAQARKLAVNEPEVFREFAAETPPGLLERLPEHVGDPLPNQDEIRNRKSASIKRQLNKL